MSRHYVSYLWIDQTSKHLLPISMNLGRFEVAELERTRTRNAPRNIAWLRQQSLIFSLWSFFAALAIVKVSLGVFFVSTSHFFSAQSENTGGPLAQALRSLSHVIKLLSTFSFFWNMYIAHTYIHTYTHTHTHTHIYIYIHMCICKNS